MSVPTTVFAIMVEYSNDQIHFNTGMFALTVTLPGQRTNLK